MESFHSSIITESAEVSSQHSDEQKDAIHQIIAGAGALFDYETVVAGLNENGWLVHPVYYDGIIVGGILQKGAELHTSIAPSYQKKWNPRAYINKILYPTLEKYGEIMSMADKSDARCLRWLQKLGFYIIKEDDHYFYLRLTEKKYERVAT
jgi:ribosomal protein S18 acetylase RimI-like enzyme